jgi:tetratricopeptide (TPR) repeat protein
MPPRTRLSRVARFAIALAGIALLAFAARDSVHRGLEDWRSARGHHDIRMWSEGRSVPSMEQWQRTVDALREALRVAPQDPELWEYLGLAYEIASRKFVPPGGWPVYSEFALIHYRQAAALRPTSPYAWAGVAVMKYRLNQLDAEFSQALASAMSLGPWESGVQLIASDIGLALWDRLNPVFKDQVR